MKIIYSTQNGPMFSTHLWQWQCTVCAHLIQINTYTVSVVCLSPVSNWFVEKRQMYHNLLLNWCFAQKATNYNNWLQICERVHTQKTWLLWVCTVDTFHKHFESIEMKIKINFKLFLVCDKCIMFSLCDNNNNNEKKIYWKWIPDGFHCNPYVVSCIYCTVQNWPKSRAKQDHLSCRCEINLDTETEWCNLQYYLLRSKAKSKREKSTSKRILKTTKCLIDSNGCNMWRWYWTFCPLRIRFYTFRSLYSINCGCHILFEFNPI